MKKKGAPRRGAIQIPKQIGGEKKKMKKQCIVIPIAVLVLLAALSMPTMALYSGNGYAFPISTSTNGTINGEVYIGGGHGVEGTPYQPNTYYQNFSVPSGTVEWARLYVGVWGATEEYKGTLRVNYTNATGTYSLQDSNGNTVLTLAGVNDTNPEVWCTGHGVYWVYYNVTNTVTPGFINNVTASTNQIDPEFDGRMYGIVLIAVVNSTKPEVQYWINDGHWNLNYAASHNGNTTYFDGTVVDPAKKSATLHTVYLTGDPGDSDTLSFNGQLVASDAADGCGEDEWGNSWCYAFDIDSWDVTEHLSSSNNYATFNRGQDPYLHPVISVLTVKSPEWVFKRSYPNYAPNGMPDFNQTQDNWRNQTTNQWSFCGPTAVANCLWWFDSKYANQTGTPGDGWDNFSLVRDYNETPPPTPGPNWDDHAFDNVNDLNTGWPPAGAPPALPAFIPGSQPQPQPIPRWGELIERLAWYVNTDGIKTPQPWAGTTVSNMAQGINDWLNDTERDNMLYVHVEKAPNATWIKNEVVKCEDVILLLGFWEPEELKYLHNATIDPRYITDPRCIWWHELYPNYCNEYHCDSWIDTNKDGKLSPSDLIDFDGDPKKWYVEDVTITIAVTNETDVMYLEFEGGYDQINQAITNPVCTWWHEIYPTFCPSFHIVNWIDNGNGELDFCDYIQFDGDPRWWHVEEVGTDIIIGNHWVRVGGHYVTVAGVNYTADACMLAFSDPYFDNNVSGGGPGWSTPGHPTSYSPALHNNASYVSHDYYFVVNSSPSPGGVNCIKGYPISPYTIENFQGMNVPHEFIPNQSTYIPDHPIHTEIEYAIVVSPKPIPDLKITKAWVNWTDGVGSDCTIKYIIKNVGEFSARGNHSTHLYVNSQFKASDLVTYGLQPGASFERNFSYTWTYTPPSDDIAIFADYNNTVEETDENNWYVDWLSGTTNTTWECGDVNNDGTVDLGDVLDTFDRFMYNDRQLHEWAADANKDTIIDLGDVLDIFDHFMHGKDLNCWCEV